MLLGVEAFVQSRAKVVLFNGRDKIIGHFFEKKKKKQ